MCSLHLNHNWGLTLGIGMGRVTFSPFRFFDFARVGFQVFGFFLWLRNFGFGFTSSPSFFLNHTYLRLIGGLVPLKVRVRWLGSGKNCLGLRKNYYRLARVLQNIARVAHCYRVVLKTLSSRIGYVMNFFFI